jgi:hypothetical protein
MTRGNQRDKAREAAQKKAASQVSFHGACGATRPVAAQSPAW